MIQALAAIAVAASYLIGSIPFGFLIARWAREIDIRTVGSGNVGATNVGRVLGFRFFVVVMLLDLFKGLGPTLGFPALLGRLDGMMHPTLAVLSGLSAILGHNYSVFLGFKGGKGVATSLGVVLALDPAAGLAAAVGFVVVLLITRYVSMSSILGGTVFVIVHFASRPRPFAEDQGALTLLIAVLYVMLIARHRGNLGRIWSGTEPKVTLGRKTRSGRSRPLILLGIAAVTLVLGGSAWLVGSHRATPTLRVGPVTFVEVARARTGHQRAGEVAFCDRGRVLAVSCPRYNRLVLFAIDPDAALTPFEDIPLDGMPVAIVPRADRLLVLQRPSGDARHLEEGYWEAFDFGGHRLGSKYRVGWDPDDLAVSPDGAFAFVLTSGDAEGEDGKPPPALTVVDLRDQTEAHRVVAEVPLEGETCDPERIVLSESGRFAAVATRRPIEVLGFDLSDPARPSMTGRTPLAAETVPYLTRTEGDDAILMPGDPALQAVVVPKIESLGAPILVVSDPDRSRLEMIHGDERRSLGRLPLRGPLNLGAIRPTGLDYCAERALIAVSDRSGGVRLIALRGL